MALAVENASKHALVAYETPHRIDLITRTIYLRLEKRCVACLSSRLLFRSALSEEIDLINNLRARWLEEPVREFSRLEKTGVFSFAVKQRLAMLAQFRLSSADFHRFETRLQRQGLLTAETAEKIRFCNKYFADKQFNKEPFRGLLEINDIVAASASRALSVLGRALEIKRIYSPSHDVFTHGSNRS
jgi:hypothetical protein